MTPHQLAINAKGGVISAEDMGRIGILGGEPYFASSGGRSVGSPDSSTVGEFFSCCADVGGYVRFSVGIVGALS